MTKYRFEMGNIGIDLPEPTIEALNKVINEGPMSFFLLPELRDKLRVDFQVMLDNKSYEVIE